MKHDCFNLLDDHGFELSVGFDFERMTCEDADGDSIYFYVELTAIEAVIKGVGIDILPQMNEKQKEWAVQHVTDYLSANHRRSDAFDIFHETDKYFRP